MTTSVSTRRYAAVLVAGIALIVLPLVGAAFKVLWPGWFLFVIMFVSPVLAIGYILQVVIAVTGFLTPRAAFRTGPARTRALWAAWLTSVGIAVTGLFFVDGGDMSWGSAFMYIIGLPSDDGAAAISYLLTILGITAWIGGWVWLLVEWIVTLVRRRRRPQVA
ncbi:hypothetical protein [Microbacterium sp. 18062]|uniref:hypothetical protein n=1 Tax=Microbacterium sp. 18062 TaxID=2681410 RepID=UPI001359E696|nr:hypothetical protein [Microbacterium sp. 18062]